jgi:hypothetical protein
MMREKKKTKKNESLINLCLRKEKKNVANNEHKSRTSIASTTQKAVEKLYCPRTGEDL